MTDIPEEKDETRNMRDGTRRHTVSFNRGWLFCMRNPDDLEPEEPRPEASPLPFASEKWQSVTIPHDFLIGDVRNLFRSAIGWYTKCFSHRIIPGKREWLSFDGVYMDSRVYINGRPVWEWKNGYTGFIVDITDDLRDGENTVWVSCTHISPNSRWYSGAGIYRNVRRISVDSHHILPNGIYIHCTGTGKEARVEIETAVSSPGVEIMHRIIDSAGSDVASGRGGSDQTLMVPNPKFWSPEDPVLYTLMTELRADGRVTDRVDTRFGFRETRFDPDEGFFLNGKHRKINGVCLHHDQGALGAAFHVAAARRQLEIMKAMGADAVRCAHNPMAPEFYDLCDELGLLVMSELTDVWKKPKTRYDYARFFNEWIEKDVKSWITSERNHPSIILWSVGNEIYDTHESPEGLKTLRKLEALVRQNDPKGNARVTLCSNYMPWKNTQRCADYIKRIGYNYSENYYESHHLAHPDWIIFGSETGSLAQSRGVYHFPLRASVLSDDDMQCSSLGNSRTSWGAKSADACIIAERDASFSLGQFIWSGFDYLGEPTPYHSKNSFLGLVDTAGLPKDIYYAFQAAWTNARKTPVLHLLPHWDHNEGQMIDVRAYTNLSAVELFVNGESQGVRQIDPLHGEKITVDWRVPYVPGHIEAVAYDENGNVVVKARRESFGDAAEIVIDAEQTELRADGTDLLFVVISVRDDRGIPVENANNRIKVTVEGAARLVGLDNGNSADFDSFQGDEKRLFSGKLVAILKAGAEPGPIVIRVSSPGLPEAKRSLHAKNSEAQACASEGEETSEKKEIFPDFSEAERTRSETSGKRSEVEIPVRKIELCATRLRLSSENPTADVRYVLRPAENTFPEVIWRVTDELGIDSPIAECAPIPGGVRVHALGDGTFALRCATRNGGVDIERYSVLFFESTGLGEPMLNPYGYISGGLYTLSGGEIGNGNERGFSSARDGISYAGFERIDFGGFGSDEMTIDVFCLDSDPLPIELWEGEPERRGSRLIGELMYHKPSIWNTYRAQTFPLPERIRGIKTLCLRFPRKAHVRGFSFTRKNGAFERRYAAECDAITGDSFERGAKEITSIGNNVTLIFSEMDFGSAGARGIHITGRSEHKTNSVQIRFRSEQNDSEPVRIVDFNRVDEPGYAVQKFEFEPVFGKNEVSFIFLPGSAFDFESFRFIRGDL